MSHAELKNPICPVAIEHIKNCNECKIGILSAFELLSDEIPFFGRFMLSKIGDVKKLIEELKNGQSPSSIEKSDPH